MFPVNLNFLSLIMKSRYYEAVFLNCRLETCLFFFLTETLSKIGNPTCFCHPIEMDVKWYSNLLVIVQNEFKYYINVGNTNLWIQLKSVNIIDQSIQFRNPLALSGGTRKSKSKIKILLFSDAGLCITVKADHSCVLDNPLFILPVKWFWLRLLALQ